MEQNPVVTNPIITIEMSNGDLIKAELYPEIAPNTVRNFISLVNKGFYNGLIFHRIIPEFMCQGGGMTINMQQKDNLKPIKGEFLSNGVNNTRKHKAGTISMARTMVKDSATSQFFICSVDTPFLDGEYAAFGEVADNESMQVVLDMSYVKTHSVGYFDDVPVEPIVIKNVEIVEE